MKDPSHYSDSTQILALTHFGGVSPRLFELLLRRYGTPESMLKAKAESLSEIEGLSKSGAKKIASARQNLDKAAEMSERLAERDIKLLSQFDAEFGHLLQELNDPPPILFFRGSFPDRKLKSAAVIGTSRAGSTGIGLAAHVTKELVGRGVQIISTLTGGIDAAVHLAARTNGGRSFAVLECGVDRLEQSEDMPVAIDIVQNGGVISEYSPDTEATADSRRASHRLVAGLAQAVIVTEMYSDSEQTLDLVRFCRDIGKLLFFIIDPEQGALADEASLALAVECGAIPLSGLEKIDDIIRSLV